MNLTSKQRFGFLALVILSFLAFQNCSKGFDASQLNSEDFIGKSLSSTRLMGNGEGYGGKLDIFASVDSLNKCGQATASQAPVREQIEVQEDGQAFKTVENCKALNPPKPISITNLQARSEDGSLFVMQDLIFQKAPWISSGFAPRDQYVDAFCLSQNPSSTNPMILDKYELSIFKDAGSLSSDMPWMPPPPAGTVYDRQGRLRTVGIDPQTNEILSDQTSLFPFQETLTLDPSSGLLSHSLQNILDSTSTNQTIFQANYSTTYVSTTGTGTNNGAVVIVSGNNVTSSSTGSAQDGSSSAQATSTGSGGGSIQLQQCWTNR